MATVALTPENFESTVDTSAIVLVDFWASWCAPCRQLAPTYERASQAHLPAAALEEVNSAVRALDVDALRAPASQATDGERTSS